jgi:hypothetical protein
MCDEEEEKKEENNGIKIYKKVLCCSDIVCGLRNQHTFFIIVN